MLHRQDVIFLTSVFPMRAARVAAGLGPDGDVLTVFRSPASLLEGCPADLSFGTWGVRDPLPEFDDDVTGFSLSSPYDGLVDPPVPVDGVPVHNPSHLSFRPSSVLVPVPPAPILPTPASGPSETDTLAIIQISPQTGGASTRPQAGDSLLDDVGSVAGSFDDSASLSVASDTAGAATSFRQQSTSSFHKQDASSFRQTDVPSNATMTGDALVNDLVSAPVPPDPGPALRKSVRTRDVQPVIPTVPDKPSRRFVRDRWFYEPVLPGGAALVSTAAGTKSPASSASSVSVTSSVLGLDSSSSAIAAVDGFPAASLAALPPPVTPPFLCVNGKRTHGAVFY